MENQENLRKTPESDGSGSAAMNSTNSGSDKRGKMISQKSQDRLTYEAKREAPCLNDGVISGSLEHSNYSKSLEKINGVSGEQRTINNARKFLSIHTSRRVGNDKNAYEVSDLLEEIRKLPWTIVYEEDGKVAEVPVNDSISTHFGKMIEDVMRYHQNELKEALEDTNKELLQIIEELSKHPGFSPEYDEWFAKLVEQASNY